MSMISSQSDELRKAVDELQNLIDNGHNHTWSGFFSTLRHAQQGLRSAAETIWELRCKLVGMVDQQDEIERLKTENEKLRELVRDMWRFTGTACKKYPRLFDHAAQGGQMVQLNMIDAFEQRMRELGIEVDG